MMPTLGAYMTESLMSRDKSEAKKKGFFAIAAWAGSGILVVFHHSFIALLAGVGAAFLTYRWFMFRAKRGMRI
jgi:hypothetical protein